MQVKVNRVKRGLRVYEYARLVRSYRNENGTPVHEVVANLGQLPPQTIKNLKAAFRAAREGKAVVIGEQSTGSMAAIPVLANLAYLDVASALEVWRRWSLCDLLAGLLPRHNDDVPAADVVASLVIQRCVSPGSKLYAQRWYPTSALPELTGMAPEQFNNSRVHRVLDALDAATPKIQEQLPTLYESRAGRFATLFLDVTDAYFEGRGCEMAERGRTKEGLRNRRKVGIVLLCDGKGNPLRWEVVPGKRSDHECMQALIEQIKTHKWIGDAPIICDRAMGRPASLDKLLRAELNFLVAAPSNTIKGHEVSLPTKPFEEHALQCQLDPSDDEVDDLEAAQREFDAEVERVRALAIDAGLERVEDSLYVIDLGIGTRPVADDEVPWIGPDDVDPTTLVGGPAMMAWARIFQRMVDSGVAKNRAAIADLTGVSRPRITENMSLLDLAPSLQEAIIRGTYGNVAERRLRSIAKLEDPAAQRNALEEYARDQSRNPTANPMRARKLRVTQTYPLRRVAYFNPAMFVSKRLRDEARQRRFEGWVAQLNTELRSRHSRRDEHSVRFLVMEKLAALKWLSMYEFTVEVIAREDGGDCLQVHATLNTDAWNVRRRYHGFVLLVASADLPQTAGELAALYRAKDMIERDFRLIKDVVELRPIYHYKDPKVRAHVTLCMLALLLQRLIEAQLSAAGISMTANRCLSLLAECHLNSLERHQLLTWLYSITKPTHQQKQILRALGLKELVDERAMAKKLVPRSALPNTESRH